MCSSRAFSSFHQLAQHCAAVLLELHTARARSKRKSILGVRFEVRRFCISNRISAARNNTFSAQSDILRFLVVPIRFEASFALCEFSLHALIPVTF
jgi:hypothetical protein